MPQSSTSRKSLAAGCYLILLLAYILFIMVASFYDTGVTNRRLSFFWNLARIRPSFHNIRDITTNILLYMPLGFFIGAGRACVPGKNVFSLPLLLAGFVLSFIFESIQSRVAALLGLQSNNRSDSTQTLMAVRLIYLLIASFVALLPLDITVRFSTLLAKLTPVMPGEKPAILLDPLFHFRAESFEFHKLLLQLLALVPLGILSTMIMQRRGLRSVFAPTLDCMLFAFAVEAAKVFVRSASSDVLVIILAPGVGLLCGLAVNKFSSAGQPAHEALADASFKQRKMVFALLAYGLFLVLWDLSPYEFELRASALLAKLQESNFLPFALHFSERSVSAAIDIVREFLLFIPFGLLSFPLLCMLMDKKFSVILICNVVLISGTAVFVEMLQLLVVGRYVDITDVLLATFGGMAGILMQPKFLPQLKSKALVQVTE